MKALPFIHQPDRVAEKASDVSAANWLYQYSWKNKIFFHVCCYGFSRSQKSLYNTAVYVIKCFLLRGNFHTTTIISIGSQYQIFYLPCNLNSFKPVWKLWLAYVALYIKYMKIYSASMLFLVKGRNHLFWCWWANRLPNVCLC